MFTESFGPDIGLASLFRLGTGLAFGGAISNWDLPSNQSYTLSEAKTNVVEPRTGTFFGVGLLDRRL